MSYRWARLNSMCFGLRPSGLLMTRSATSAPTQAIATLLYRPEHRSSASNTPSVISSTAISTLNTSQTTRPGWLCVSRAKKLRPGQRAGVGVGEVDLHLRDDDEQHRGGQHPGRVARTRRRSRPGTSASARSPCRRGICVLQHQEGEEGAAQHLQHARHDPARPGDQHRGPPARAVGAASSRAGSAGSRPARRSAPPARRPPWRRRRTSAGRSPLLPETRPASVVNSAKACGSLPEHRSDRAAGTARSTAAASTAAGARSA